MRAKQKLADVFGDNMYAASSPGLGGLQAEAEDLFDVEPGGRGCGAVRGGYRGRGHAAFPPRGRGGYRGRGLLAASFHSGRSSVKRVDHRPRRIAVSSIVANSSKDEALRQYLIVCWEMARLESKLIAYRMSLTRASSDIPRRRIRSSLRSRSGIKLKWYPIPPPLVPDQLTCNSSSMTHATFPMSDSLIFRGFPTTPSVASNPLQPRTMVKPATSTPTPRPPLLPLKSPTTRLAALRPTTHLRIWRMRTWMLRMTWINGGKSDPQYIVVVHMSVPRPLCSIPLLHVWFLR